MVVCFCGGGGDGCSAAGDLILMVVLSCVCMRVFDFVFVVAVVAFVGFGCCGSFGFRFMLLVFVVLVSGFVSCSSFCLSRLVVLLNDSLKGIYFASVFHVFCFVCFCFVSFVQVLLSRRRAALDCRCALRCFAELALPRSRIQEVVGHIPSVSTGLGMATCRHGRWGARDGRLTMADHPLLW